LKDLNKQLSLLNKQLSETQEQISQTKAEEEVLKYQIETSRKKNAYYEQDISQAK
jgi:peptidoglycan hydrolase CwlO-like protein